MPIIIKVNNVDKTSLIDWHSITLTRILTSQVDTLDFSIKRYGSKNFKPQLLDNIELWENSVKLFGGKVVSTDEEVQGARLEVLQVSCKDHSHEMDKHLVIRVYENETVEDIIEDIKDTFLPAGFTTNHVSATQVVGYISFNYEQPTKCFQQLAELVGYDWYVDVDKDIHFFSKDTNVAPFELTDTNGKYFFNTLKVRRDIKNLRNVIYVRGGTFRGTLFIEEQEADGDTKVFTQGFQYSDIVVKKNGNPLTVGIDNIHDPSTKDVLYNFNEKAVKFRDDNKPAAADIIHVEGLPHIPVIIKTKDNASIGTYTDYEHKIIDKSINSKEGARDRAKGEILSWAQQINEGEFITKESGLEVGQRIRIQSTIRNIDEYFVINRLTSKLKTPDEMEHSVELISTQTFGAIEFLQKLLMNKDKEITIMQDEVLDKIEAAIESILLTESFAVLLTHHAQLETITSSEVVVVRALNYPTVFVYGDYPVPTGYNRELALDGGVLM